MDVDVDVDVDVVVVVVVVLLRERMMSRHPTKPTTHTCNYNNNVIHWTRETTAVKMTAGKCSHSHLSVLTWNQYLTGSFS